MKKIIKKITHDCKCVNCKKNNIDELRAKALGYDKVIDEEMLKDLKSIQDNTHDVTTPFKANRDNNN